jgi:hypothetical protein
VPYSLLLSEVKRLYKQKSEWREWVKEATQQAHQQESSGKEIREVLHLGSHIMAVTHLGICYSFDICK